MRPVMQTRYGDPGGNCFEACIASITGIELERIPHFLGEGWFEDYVAWLRHAGWNAVWWDAGAGGIPPGFAIASGPGPRGVRHSVVSLDGELAHDPHPSNASLESVDMWTLVWRREAGDADVLLEWANREVGA